LQDTEPVFRILDILALIRIQICVPVPQTYGSGSCSGSC